MTEQKKAREWTTSMCGNCNGTGDEGLGIMPDSAGPCDACDGRGYHVIDPSQKGYSLLDLLKMTKEEYSKIRASGTKQEGEK